MLTQWRDLHDQLCETKAQLLAELHRTRIANKRTGKIELSLEHLLHEVNKIRQLIDDRLKREHQD